jgi:hypothetical protein
MGIAGCYDAPSGGEPGQAGTGLAGIFVSSNWSRPGPSYLYDEIALPAGGNGGASGNSSTSASGSASGGHSGGSSSGGGGASSGGSSSSGGK